MSRIDDLITELVPKGVEFRPLSELLNYEQPTKYLVASTDYSDSFPTPVLTAGQTFILGHTAESRGIYPASPEHPVVIFDDFTTAFKWVDFPFKAKSSAMKMLTASPGAAVDFRFVYYAMLCIGFIPQEHARHWIAQYSNFRIPVPPLAVQQEIVRILDKFMELEAELEAELKARRRQYDHYRTRLLEDDTVQVEFVELGRLGRVVTGRTPRASDTSAWGSSVDFVTPSDIRNGTRLVSAPSRRLSKSGASAMSKALIPSGALLVTCIGADMGKTVINANDCVTNQQINAVIPSGGIHVAYLFHVLTAMREELRTQGEQGGGTMPIINKSDFSKIKVPIPSLAHQKDVAAQLDKFDTFVNDLNVGLPAELTGRRKQYGYYRDHLLAFEEVSG